MPRACTICAHPEREAVEAAMVNGESFRDIARRFRVGKDAAARHKADHLPEHLVKAREVEDAAKALDVMDELRRCFERVNLLFDACDRWLRDADDPARYDIGPRAEELRVTYEERHGERTVRRKATLAELLAKVAGSSAEAGRTVTMVETKHADPRELVLKTAGRLQPQIELLAKLIGELDERLQVNILVSAEWVQIRTAMLEALAPYSDARAAVAGRLTELEAGSPGG